MAYLSEVNWISVLLINAILIAELHAETIQNKVENQFYVGGFVASGFSSTGNTNIPSIASKPPLTSEPVYHSGNSFGLNFGYHVHPSIRVEAELSYQKLPMDKINDAIGVGTITHLENSNTKLFNAFINGYYDFNYFRNWIPYAGLGMGYTDVKNTITPTPPIPVAPGIFFTKKSISYNTVGYQGILGLEYIVTSNVHLSLDYRYFRTFSKKSTGDTNLGLDSYQTEQRIKTNMLLFSVKFYL